MWLKINLLTVSVVFLSIGRSFLAILLNPNLKELAEDYLRLRNASVYRGILFSLSPARKNEICRDIFHAQLYAISDGTENEADENNVNRLITDRLPGPVTDEPAQHPLLLAKIIADGGTYPDWEDIFFKCVGGPFEKRIPSYNEYYVSSAFLFNWYYASIKDDTNPEFLELNYYIASSPEYVPFEQAEVEDYYMIIRKTIDELKEESSDFVKLIEERDNLSSLSKWQKFLLCASILSSPIYRKDRLEFSLDWIYDSYSSRQHKENLTYLKRIVAFRNPYYADEYFALDCILCKAFHDTTDRDGGWKNLYLTRSYGNDHSLIVLIEDSENIFLDKYFRNVPLLMNAHENMDSTRLFVNFQF